MSNLSVPPTPPLFQQIEGTHPGLLTRLFALQLSMTQKVVRTPSIAELNATGQLAFGALDEFAASLADFQLSADEQTFLNDAIDDARIVIRGRAEMRMLALEGQKD